MGRATTSQTTGRTTGGPPGPARARSFWLRTQPEQKYDADISGVERVEGGGYGEPNRDEPGSTKMCRYGKVALSTGVSHVTVWGYSTAS